MCVCRPYFYLNLLLYVIFTAFLTAYCLLITSHLDTPDTQGIQSNLL